MAKRVIHWSRTFPAKFSSRISSIINDKIGYRYHFNMHLNDLDQMYSKNDVNVVHSALNLREFVERSGCLNPILIVHGQPDTSQLSLVAGLLKKYNLSRTLVTTPDLLGVIPGANLFPFIPVDMVQTRNLILPIQSNGKHIRCFSKWKAEAYSLMQSSRNYEAFRIKCFAYGKIRESLSRRGKLYPIRVWSSKPIERLFVSDPDAYFHSLTNSKYVLDTDYFDFANGGNISMTGWDALACGRPIISGISQKNLTILKHIFDNDFHNVHTASNLKQIWDLREIFYSEHCPPNYIDDGQFSSQTACDIWKAACPEFF